MSKWPVALILLLGQIAVVPPMVTADDQRRPEERLAEALLQDLEIEGKRIAVSPFHRSAGLPERLYHRLTNALHAIAADRRVTLLTHRLGELAKLHEEHYSDDIDLLGLLRSARADVQILCSTVEGAAAGHVSLSCEAADLVTTREYGYGIADFELEWNEMIDFTIANMVEPIVEHAPGSLERKRVTFTEAGCESELGEYIGRHLLVKLNERIRGRARQESRAVTGRDGEPGAASGTTGYYLEGRIWRGDVRVELEVTIRDDDTIVDTRHRMIAFSANSPLPPRFAAGCKTYGARAAAVVSEGLDRDSARRAALNLARARVIAKALYLSPPGMDDVTGTADGWAALGRYLPEGLPVDEQEKWERTSGEERVAVYLQARVAPLGFVGRPKVAATLDRERYRAGEPITIMINSDEPVHLGLFAWGADDSVVRLYPAKSTQTLMLDAGEKLVLPRRDLDEPYIMSGPLPGHDEDHEAFIVVATPHPADFSALANATGTSVADTINQARGAAAFFAGLAELDRARMTVVVLLYQVHT